MPKTNPLKKSPRHAGSPKVPSRRKGTSAADSAQRFPETRPTQRQQTRLWLMYPARLIKMPVIWQLGHRFKLVTNVRQASVNDEIGVVCLELDGERAVIKAAIKWLEHLGIRVEPVEIGVIES